MTSSQFLGAAKLQPLSDEPTERFKPVNVLFEMEDHLNAAFAFCYAIQEMHIHDRCKKGEAVSRCAYALYDELTILKTQREIAWEALKASERGQDTTSK